MKQQISFFNSALKEHGGELSFGKRKGRRPVAVRSPMHVVLKSNESSLLKNEKRVRQILQKFSYRFFVKLYDVSVNTNHIHLCALAKTREGFHHFERAVAGTIALTISSCHKGSPLLSSFWEQIIYSRLVSWGRDFENTLCYIKKNFLEATGQIPYFRERRRPKRRRETDGIRDDKRMNTSFNAGR